MRCSSVIASCDHVSLRSVRHAPICGREPWTNHLIVLVVLFLLAVIVLVFLVIVVIVVQRAMVVTAMERLMGGSDTVLGVLFALHPTLSELFHHVDEMFPVILE